MLGLALQARGIAAVSLTANQCGIHTDGSFNKARVRAVETARLVQELGAGRVVIVAGFQGVTVNDDITTLGTRRRRHHRRRPRRGARRHVVRELHRRRRRLHRRSARRRRRPADPHLSYEECIELAAAGAKVLHPRAAEICMQYKVPIHVRHSFSGKPGTWVREGAAMMERPRSSA
jgi:aspartate kinase